MKWLCPDCKTESLVVVDVGYKECSKLYCQECKKYKSFDKWIIGNQNKIKKVNK